MAIRIDILTDNRSRAQRFACEHGLSVLVRTAHSTTLLDTGQTDKAVQNAHTLGIDLGSIDTIVLSHGHYDHCGGLGSIVGECPNAQVVMHADALRPKFSLSSVMLKPNGFPRPEVLESVRLRRVNGITQLSPEVTVFTLPQSAPANRALVIKDEQGSLVPDPFTDELFTLIRSEGKSILYGGCTHHGLEMLLDFAFNQFNLSNLSLFIGGLHLSGRSADEISAAADTAGRYNVGRWIVNHCTGEQAISLWHDRFGAQPTDGFAGSSVTL